MARSRLPQGDPQAAQRVHDRRENRIKLVTALISLLVVVVGGAIGYLAKNGVAGQAPQVTVEPPQSSSASAPSAVSPHASQTHYLDEMATSQHKGCGMQKNGTFQLGSTPYPRSVAIVAEICTGGGPNYVEYVLDPAYGCTDFRAELGVPATDDEKAKATMEVLIDSHPVTAATTLVRGRAVEVRSAVRPASVIRLQMENTATGAGFLSVTGVFGDALVDCTA